jgi:regulator of replication initiation timing
MAKPAANVDEERAQQELQMKGRSTVSDYVQIYIIEVLLEKAEDLVKADVFGLSDPYCQVTAFGQTYTTKTVLKNLNPIWSEKTTFAFFEDPGKLIFRVWDWDKGTKDDAIGDCEFSLNGFFSEGHKGYQGKLTLQNVKKGEIYVSIKCKKLVPHELEELGRQLQNDIHDQENKIFQQNATIDDYSQKNAQVNVNIGEIEKQIEELNSKMKSLEGELSALRYEETTLRNQLAQLEKEKKKNTRILLNRQKNVQMNYTMKQKN